MKFSTKKIALHLAGCLLLLSACGGSSTSKTPDPALLFQSVGKNVIVPTYEAFVAQSAELIQATESLCALPSEERLVEAQGAWRRARVPLKQSEAFRFGPVKMQGIDSAVDFWPTRPNNIEAFLSGTEAITESSIGALGTSAKGLPALEYLFFDPVGGNAAVLNRLTDALTGARRCEFIVALSRDVLKNAEALVEAWDGSGHYLQKLVDAGQDSTVYPTTAAAVSDFVNSLVFVSEAVQGNKLGQPLGKRSGGTPQPDLVESFFSGNSLEDILNNLQGVQNTYLARRDGLDGLGFDDYVRTKDPALADAVERQIQISMDAVRAIPPPLSQAVTSGTPLVEIAYQEVRRLQVLLETDLSSALGATITFSDNDGD